ncbi:hypothetical protein [Rhodococcus opacus]|nr:hypothetical protein [Rhodococcus opacus]
MKQPKNMSIEELTAHIVFCKDLRAQRIAESLKAASEEKEISVESEE